MNNKRNFGKGIGRDHNSTQVEDARMRRQLKTMHRVEVKVRGQGGFIRRWRDFWDYKHMLCCYTCGYEGNKSLECPQIEDACGAKPKTYLVRGEVPKDR